MNHKYSLLRCSVVLAIGGIFTLFLLVSCGGDPTPSDTKYLPDFHIANFVQNHDMLEEDNLSLYVDYSTCIEMGQHSSFYRQLVPSFVEATKSYYSIKGATIKEENLADSSTYMRLLSVREVNYADIKTAAERIANGNSEGALLTDGEYYTKTIAGGNPNNPYMADALKTWLKKGHDIYIISEPYVEVNRGVGYNKKRFFFLFTDSRLRNNIYDRICETASLEKFPEVQVFHLSADHPSIMAAGNSSEPNPTLAASVEAYGSFEIQDWTVDWGTIQKYIMDAIDQQTGEALSNGEYVVKGLKIDRNSFGGYRIKDITMEVFDINEAYMSFYEAKDTGAKIGLLTNLLPICPNFMMIDKNEFSRHGNIDLYFDVQNFNNGFLTGNPFNYFKIDLYISDVENIFSQQYAPIFTFDLLGQPGVENVSLLTSIEQCLTDKELQTQMMHSPFYTIYVKSNKY